MFQGRVSRGYYWKAVLIMIGFSIIFAFVIAAGMTALILGLFSGNAAWGLTGVLLAFIPLALLYIALVLLGIGLNIRRLHDIGLTGWIVLLPWVVTIFAQIVGRSSTSPLGLEPWALGVVCATGIFGIVIGLWPGQQVPNRYGDPVTYRSWWAALIGSKQP